MKRQFWLGKPSLAFLAGALLVLGAAPPTRESTSTPVAPSNLTATAQGSDQIQLAWIDNSSNETYFYIERAPEGFSFTVQASVSANTTSYLDTDLLPGVTYSYRVRAWNSRGYSGYSNTDSATTFAPPAVSQPPGSQTVLAGATVSFSVTATGTEPLSYQWQFNSADLSGATGTSLTLTNAQPTNEGNYTVVVTNSEGSVTSAVAVLTVLVPPAITAQPLSLTNLAGTIASFSATATGTKPLNYQWRLNGLNLADGGRISGATSNALTVTSIQASDTGSYTLVVSNAGGVVTSVVATLTIRTPPGITAQPASQGVAIGSTVIFSVTASGTPPLSYQWRKNGADLTDGANLSGTTTATLMLENVQTNDAGDYQMVVTNSLGPATSTVATLAVGPPFQPVSQSAGAVVLVNSHSARYPDFQHFIQPYLDNFGFPYTVLDLTTNAPDQSISNCAVIIIGHSQLDTNRSYLSAAVQANLSLAVSNGTGLVSFDNDLYAGGAPRYQFVQDIFGFSYGSGASGTNASLPPTEPSSQMHYITARHPTNDVVAFRASITLPGITVPATATTLARVGGQSLVAVVKCGQGRAVQWGSYDWMVSTVLGPVDGLDDVMWRAVVWAARKPIVMRGMPNFVTMRVDDVSGPFTWVHAANAVGFKPFVALFYLLVSDTSAADLATLTTSGKATASIHSTDNGNTFFYFNHATEQPWPDNVQSNNFYLGTQWHLSHGIPMSKVCATHWSEIGLNCFAGLKAWGMEFVPIEVVPGTVEYSNNAPWVVDGPYRLYETPQPGRVSWPTYYADWLTVPGHPEFDGQFFDIYSEVRDVASCGEWCPNNSDVPGSISRATQMAKRALDSMVMTTIFSHESYISPISTANWQAILQGITNNLASYNPIYVTLDYASQYVRATRTSRLVSCALDPGSGQVMAAFSGTTDLDTRVYVFGGAENSITSSYGNVPAFSASLTNPVVVAGPPTILNAPSSRTNQAGTTAVFSVGGNGTWPLSYRWYRNGTNALSDGGQIAGAGDTTLTISNLLGGNAGSYTVVVSNALGIVTSTPPAVLTVVDPVITTQPVSRTNIAGTTAVFNVGVYGTTLAYQWLKNGAPISGATNTTLSLTNVSSSNAGIYMVTVSNFYGSVASSNATLAVFYVPTANNDSYGAAAGTTLTVAAPGVLANDTVAGGGNLTAMLVSGPIHGTLSLNPDGSFTYTPLTNYVGTDSFAYQAVNGPTNSGVATVSISMTAGGVLFSDDFTRLADPGPLSPWVVRSGNWAVTGGALQAGPNAVQSYGYAYLTNSWTNYSVEGRIEFSTTGAWGGGIGGRLNAATGAHYAAWVYPEGSPDGSNVLRLVKFQTWTSFGYNGSIGAAMEQASLAATGTNWHTVKLAFHGDQIAVFYDGNRVMSVRDTEAQPYSSGGITADIWTYLLPYTMSVGDVIVRPLVVDDSYSGTMETPLTVADPGVLGNDTGVYTTNLVAALVSGPTNGTLNLGTNGGFTYSPATNYYGTDSFSYQANQGSNDLGTATVMITVVPDLPLIIQIPSSRTNTAGTTAVFGAAALGTLPLSYQWYWNGTNGLTDGGKVSGARSETLTISNTLSGDAGSYTVVVTNALGSVTSTPPALLTVVDPIITSQPVSQTNIAGTTAVFNVGAYGTTPTYQWLKNGALISGATNTTLSLTNVSDSDAGSYGVTVSNASGSVVSSNATLVVFYYVPTVNGDSYGVAAGTYLTVAAPGVLGNDTVVGGGNLTATLVSGPIHGTLSLNADGGFTYTPLTNYVGTDGFGYQAVNGPSISGVATVSILMTAGGVLFSDDFTRLADPGPLSPWVVQSGNWAVTGGALTGGTNPIQSHGYAYIANNWTNYSVEGRIRFSSPNAWGGGIGGRLNPATGGRYAAWVYPEGSPGGSNVLKLVKFQTWTNFGYNGSIGAAMAQASLAATGTNWHTVKLAFHGNQIAVFYDGNRVISARDAEAQPYSSGGISADVWTYLLPYTMSVNDVIVRPLVVDDSYSGTMDTPLTVADPGVLGNDTGVYTTNLVAVVVSGPTNGTLNLGTNGGFTYSPATNYYGTDSFSYQANEGSNDLGTATVMFTVVPDLPLIIHTPSSRTNIAGTTAVFSAAALGTLPLSYQWFWNGTNGLTDGGKVSGARSATLTISNTLSGDAGSYTVVVTNALGSVTSAPPAVLTVWDPPVITAAPAGSTNLAGATAVLSVEAAGTEPLSYQWYRDVTNALSDGSAVTGSASNVLTLVNVLGADGGAYTVVVSNEAGAVTSTPPAMLTVIDPVITAQPVSQTNLAGSAAVFSVQAYGTAPQYQWYKNGEPVSGGTQAELVLAGVTGQDAGGYSVVVSNAYGSVSSSTANLTVWDPPVITAAPAGSTNLAGATAVLSVEAAGTEPLSYQWCRDVTNALSDGSAVTGSASNVLTLVNVLGADGGAYTVVVSNEAGAVTSTPPAMLTVIDPVITAQPVSQTNLAGSAAVFGVQAYGTAPQYQWYKNGEPVSGVTRAKLVLARVTDEDAGGYSVVVGNPYGSVSSSTAMLTVLDPPVITAAPAGSTNLAGATAVLSVEAAGTEPLSYQWYRDVTNALSDGSAVTGSASNVLTLVNVLGADGGAYTVVVSNEAGAVTSTPPAMLTVIDPVITAQPMSRTNHAGSTAVFSVQAYGTAPEYQWYKNSEPVSGGTQAELVLAGVTGQDAGGYSVVVSNAYGTASSSMADLAVAPPLSIEFIALGEAGVTIGWSAVPGQSYLLQSKDNLEDTNWTPVLPMVTATAPSVLLTNALKNSTQQFYRAILLP